MQSTFKVLLYVKKGGFQAVKDPTDKTKLVLAIDRKSIAE